MGVDATLGKRRCVVIRRSRFAKGRKRGSRLRILTNVDKHTKSLARTNVQAASILGAKAKGVTPSAIKAYRGALGTAFAVRKSGGRTATALMMGLGFDPAYSLRLEVIEAWIELMTENPSLQKRPQGQLESG